ncbi:MAG: hypothetical protein PVJ39_20400 [Gammaproteobacteria bacterium]|jgi:hypothetical protein
MQKSTMIVEHSELALWTGLWQAVPPSDANDLGISLHKVDLATALIMEKMPDWMFNRVLGFGLEAAATEQALDKLIALYDNKNLPIGVSLSPDAQPENIARWLDSRGFEIVNHWVKMIRGHEAPPDLTTDLEIVEVGTDHATLVGSLICAGFDLPDKLLPVFSSVVSIPDNHVYLAQDGDIPVGAGCLTIHNDIGHLNTATTLQTYRKRGIQGALMAHRIREGIKMGCNWFATETAKLPDQPNPSYNNMLRCGFHEHYQRPNYVKYP